jgi:hypothetical protein
MSLSKHEKDLIKFNLVEINKFMKCDRKGYVYMNKLINLLLVSLTRFRVSFELIIDGALVGALHLQSDIVIKCLRSDLQLLEKSLSNSILHSVCNESVLTGSLGEVETGVFIGRCKSPLFGSFLGLFLFFKLVFVVGFLEFLNLNDFISD